MHALVDRRARDARRGEADALVDHVHAGIARAHGDLLGAVRVAVEPRLADQDLDAPPELLGHPLDALAQLSQGVVGGAAAASPTPVGARYSPKVSRSAAAHSPVVAPAFAAAQRGGHDVHLGVGRGGSQLVERRLDRGAVARRAPGAERLDRAPLDIAGQRAGCRRPRRPEAASGSASV